MQIFHRIVEHASSPFYSELDKFGVEYEKGDILSVLEIKDNDALWPKINELIKKFSITYTSTSRYSKKELLNADWLVLSAKGHHGYPKPDNDFGYIETTYDTADYCQTCGIGLVQNELFRIQKDSDIRKDFLQLNWVFDEFFVSKKIKVELQKNSFSGFEFKDILIHRKNIKSELFAQLFISEILPKSILKDKLFKVTCKNNNEEKIQSENDSHCGRVKYHWPQPGPISINKELLKGAPDIIKTSEWFGSGASASRMIIISNKFAKFIIENKWRGVSFEPIKLL